MRRELKLGPWVVAEDGAIKAVCRDGAGEDAAFVFALSALDAREMHSQLGEAIGVSRETMWRRVALVAIGALGVVWLMWLGASQMGFFVLGLGLSAVGVAERRWS